LSFFAFFVFIGFISESVAIVPRRRRGVTAARAANRHELKLLRGGR
jgi:hypothetical protein